MKPTEFVSQFLEGMKAARDNHPCAADRSDAFKRGYRTETNRQEARAWVLSQH